MRTHGSSGAWVSLDSASILRVRDSWIGERDIRNGIIWLSTHGSNTQPTIDFHISKSFSILTTESTYCPPEQVMPVTVILVPLVTATQSSWFLTIVLLNNMLVVLEISKPSELCAAGRPDEAAFGASPAELSRVRPVIVTPVEPVISKQWTGQFWMYKFLITMLVASLSQKWHATIAFAYCDICTILRLTTPRDTPPRGVALPLVLVLCLSHSTLSHLTAQSSWALGRVISYSFY